jgi:hypothetical protein
LARDEERRVKVSKMKSLFMGCLKFI